MQRCCNGFPISLIQSALTMSARLKNKVNIFSVKNLAVPFLNLLEANEEIVNPTIFSYAKKRYLQAAAVTVFVFFFQLQSPTRATCGLDVQI